MMLWRKVAAIYASAIVVAVAVPAFAQEPPPPPGGGPDRYIEAREAHQRVLGRDLQAAGRGANLTAIRAVVKANLRRRNYSMPVTNGTPERLHELDVEDVAQFLATLGYTPSDLAPGNPQALDLVESASRAVLGGSSLRDMVRLSPIVVVAELAAYTPDTQTDGVYRSTANFRVVESIKGGLAEGATVAFRQKSGPLPNGQQVRFTAEVQPETKARLLLFLSEAAYQVRGRKGPAAAGGQRLFSTAGTPHEVLPGDTVRPIADSESNGGTLAEVRTFAR